MVGGILFKNAPKVEKDGLKNFKAEVKIEPQHMQPKF